MAAHRHVWQTADFLLSNFQSAKFPMIWKLISERIRGIKKEITFWMNHHDMLHLWHQNTIFSWLIKWKKLTAFICQIFPKQNFLVNIQPSVVL
jgi:hypothetical protein